jgi:hypothetical protein
MLEGQAAPRLDESRGARRQGQRDPGRDEGTTTSGRERHRFSGTQVRTSVAGAGVGRSGQVRVEAQDRDVEHDGTLLRSRDPTPT